jgi:hypothetical protein
LTQQPHRRFRRPAGCSPSFASRSVCFQGGDLSQAASRGSAGTAYACRHHEDEPAVLSRRLADCLHRAGTLGYLDRADVRGAPRLMLPNASGLTWIDPQHLLFSEIRQGRHMAIVTSMENRNAERDVWLTPREASVAHRSQVSPDGKWVLVVWMGTGAIGGCANAFPSKVAQARDRLDQRTRPAARPHDLRMGAGCISVRLPGEGSILLHDGGSQVRISGSQLRSCHAVAQRRTRAPTAKP